MAFKNLSYPVQCGPLIINAENHEVRIQGRLLNLSPTEIQVLYCFARRVGDLVTRDDVLSAVWGNDKAVKGQIVDVYLKRLRAICKAETKELSFRTVSKMGYQLLVRPSAPASLQKKHDPPSGLSTNVRRLVNAVIADGTLVSCLHMSTKKGVQDT
jgi:DNA-binding winged helix-turn-helix (wHTH) protein